MEYLAKIVNGIIPCNGPLSALQICYLQYTDDEELRREAKMTDLYQLNMPKIDKLLKKVHKRYETLKKCSPSSAEDEMWFYGVKERETIPFKNESLIERDLWLYDIFSHALGKTSPYATNNSNELTVYEWKIRSAISDAFIFNRIRFDSVTVIIENNMEHWFGIKKSSTPVFTYRRSRPRPRSLLPFECQELPLSPIVSAANNSKYKSKCDDCGKCNQITMPMETYCFRRKCKNPTKKTIKLEQGQECTENVKLKFNLKNIFATINLDK